jgi:hypothetical protein
MALRNPETNTERFRRAIAYAHNGTPEELAALLVHNRVKRGKRLLWRIKPGWWRSCLDDGRSRIRLEYSEESSAALAFEYDERFADEFGYVQDWKVLPHFFGRLWQQRALWCGLSTSFHHHERPFPKRYPKIAITAEALNQEWAKLVENPPGEWRIQHRHPTALDRRLAEIDVGLGPPKGRMRRLLAGVPILGQFA